MISLMVNFGCPSPAVSGGDHKAEGGRVIGGARDEPIPDIDIGGSLEQLGMQDGRGSWQ